MRLGSVYILGESSDPVRSGPVRSGGVRLSVHCGAVIRSRVVSFGAVERAPYE